MPKPLQPKTKPQPPKKKKEKRQPIPTKDPIVTHPVCLPAEGDGLLNQATVLAAVSIRSPVTLWIQIRAKRFPAPIKPFGNGTNRWRISDIRTHLEKMAAADPPPPPAKRYRFKKKSDPQQPAA